MNEQSSAWIAINPIYTRFIFIHESSLRVDTGKTQGRRVIARHRFFFFFFTQHADSTIRNEELRKRFERFITFGHPVVRALTDDFRFQLKHKFVSLRGIHGFAKRCSKLKAKSKLVELAAPWRVERKIGRAWVEEQNVENGKEMMRGKGWRRRVWGGGERINLLRCWQSARLSNSSRWPFNGPLLQRMYTVLCFIPAVTSRTRRAPYISLSFPFRLVS